jgi:hypothetical protein
MWPFAKSVILGALTGSAPILMFTILLSASSLPDGLNGDGHLLPSLWLVVLPLVVAAPIVFVASLLVGLPLTLLLRRKGWESGAVYISVGAGMGFVLPIAGLLLMSAPAGYWMSILGAVSGAVTGRTWWVSAREPNISFPA